MSSLALTLTIIAVLMVLGALLGMAAFLEGDM